MSTQQWMEDRRMGVGASESAALFGVHPFLSQYALWASKVEPKPWDEEGNERQEDGKAMEPRIAARYQKATGRNVWEPPQKMYRHPRYERMIASPDRFASGSQSDHPPICVELKLFEDHRAGDEFPAYTLIQNQQQMACVGSHTGSIAILGSFRCFEYQDFERNDEFIAILQEKIEAFWKLVESRTPPTADGSHSTAEALKRLFPKDQGATVFLDGECAAWADKLELAKSAIKEAEKVKLEAENIIKAAIKDATFAKLPDGTSFSLKSQSRAAHMVAVSEFRVLRRTK